MFLNDIVNPLTAQEIKQTPATVKEDGPWGSGEGYTGDLWHGSGDTWHGKGGGGGMTGVEESAVGAMTFTKWATAQGDCYKNFSHDSQTYARAKRDYLEAKQAQLETVSSFSNPNDTASPIHGEDATSQFVQGPGVDDSQAVLGNSNMAEGQFSPMYYNGDQVELAPEYADQPNEVYTVSQSDQERGRCWISDADGRGWYARFDQLIPAETVGDDEDADQINELAAGYASNKGYAELGRYKNNDTFVSKKKYNNIAFIAVAENPRNHKVKFRTNAPTQQEAVGKLHAECDKEIDVATKVSGDATMDFNVDFVREILEMSANTFYAKIVPGPKLVIAGKEMEQYPDIMRSEGFKPSTIRNKKSSEGATKLPGVDLRAAAARAAELIANGRYILGAETIDKDGNRVFDLTLDSVVPAKNAPMRMGVPAVTIGTDRNEMEEGYKGYNSWGGSGPAGLQTRYAVYIKDNKGIRELINTTKAGQPMNTRDAEAYVATIKKNNPAKNVWAAPAGHDLKEAGDRVDPILIKALNRMPDGLNSHGKVLNACYDAYAMELGRMEMKSNYGTTHAYVPQLMDLYKQKYGLTFKEAANPAQQAAIAVAKTPDKAICKARRRWNCE